MPQLTPTQILEEIRANFSGGARRKFLPGLLLAFIGFLRELDATGGKFQSLEDFFNSYPRQTQTSRGAVNTLIVSIGDGKTLSIRRFYDAAANWFRAGQKRYDYPSSAPHATQAWGDYTHWLDALLSYDNNTLDHLDAETRAFVLDALPSQEVDPSSVSREPARFLRFLEEFDMTAKRGETSGACYQGTVFGFIRADAPHLQVEVGKVRTGSKREKRVGDIDARDGETLVLSAEVKQFVLGEDAIDDLAEFGNLISKHRALGLVVAFDFTEGVGVKLVEMGLRPVSKQDLIDRVRLWDPLKQRIATHALLYYAGFREQNSALTKRITEFLETVEAEMEAIDGTEPGEEHPGSLHEDPATVH
jgi:hypothetical protein